MNFDLENRLVWLKQQYGDRILTPLTISLALLMFVVAPLHATGSIAVQVLAAVVALTLIGGALVVSTSTKAFAILLIGFILNFSAIILPLHGPLNVDLYLVASAWLIFAITLGHIVSRAVFGPGRVNYHRIIGAFLLYMLIALGFSSVFVFFDLLVPHAISGINFEDHSVLASQLFYFNFVTLTSVGYGDIVPVHAIARSLSNLEAILGQFYPAVLLARLVTLEASHRLRA